MTASRANENSVRSRRRGMMLVLGVATFLAVVLCFCAGRRCLETMSAGAGECIADKVAHASFLDSSLEDILLSLPDVAAVDFVGSADFPLLTDEGVSRCVLQVSVGDEFFGEPAISTANLGPARTIYVKLLFVVSRNKVFPATVMTQTVINELANASRENRPTLTSLLHDFPVLSWNEQQTACSPSVLGARSLDSWCYRSN